MKTISIIWVMCTVLVHTAVMTTARYLTEDWWIHAGFTLLVDLCIAIVAYAAASRIKMMYSETERSMYLMKVLKVLPKKINLDNSNLSKFHGDIINYIRGECDFIEKISCDLMFNDDSKTMITCAWRKDDEVKNKIFVLDMRKRKCKEFTGHYEVSTLSPKDEEVEFEPFTVKEEGNG